MQTLLPSSRIDISVITFILFSTSSFRFLYFMINQRCPLVSLGDFRIMVSAWANIPKALVEAILGKFWVWPCFLIVYWTNYSLLCVMEIP